jgi:hypothetical protein
VLLSNDAVGISQSQIFSVRSDRRMEKWVWNLGRPSGERHKACHAGVRMIARKHQKCVERISIGNDVKIVSTDPEEGIFLLSNGPRIF